MAGFCEENYKPLGSVKHRNFLATCTVLSSVYCWSTLPMELMNYLVYWIVGSYFADFINFVAT
jgi:hypothetical protein